VLYKHSWPIIFCTILIGSIFTVVPASAQLPNSATNSTDVFVAMKHTKKMTLVSVRNDGDLPIYSVELENPNGAIRFVKAKAWDRERVNASTLSINACSDSC